MGFKNPKGRHRRGKVLNDAPKRKNVRAQLTDQEHLMHDGDDTEIRFNLMACQHPGKCACEAKYPHWKPGQR